MLEAIPVAGPPLKAAIGGLLEILRGADVSSAPNILNCPKLKNEKRSELLRIGKTSRG
jgi:hypothetical protein